MLWLARHPDASTGQRAASMGLLLDLIAETWGTSAIEPFLTDFASVFEPRSPLRGILADALPKDTRLMYATIQDEPIAKGKDEGLLQRWFDRAVMASTVAEIFED